VSSISNIQVGEARMKAKRATCNDEFKERAENSATDLKPLPVTCMDAPRNPTLALEPKLP
jgi:hypothetical protein